MDEKFIGPGGRWMIFAGAPMFFVALLLAVTGKDLPLGGLVGDKAAAYLTTAIVVAFFVVAMVLYGRIPKPFVIPIGITGWVLTFVLSCWYFWFGPGALKM